ncbi:MAG: BspA family leucine-rich repeat surface protein, partial [Bacteroidales bacterium]|nr:BspA family leucine-rich repeat surface protein [Bacteroidales bacterium]
TFYYNSSKPEGALPILLDWDDANWPTEVRESVTKVVFDNSFKDYEPTSCAYWFYKFKNLTEISGIKENLNTANVTDMEWMFRACSSLTTLDVSNFNTANVTDMKVMFYDCRSLTTLDVSNFNTANVTDMSYMFYGCSHLTTLDLSNFNTANVTNMGIMFNNCRSLITLDLSNFNTANVTNMSDMFEGCSSLNAIFVGDDWSTASVTKSSGMFVGCAKLYGGKGTGYNADITDATYAKIDGGKDAPGYFTKSGEPAFKIVVSIEITTAPKTNYLVGEDFSAANGIITLTYNNGDKETINLSDATISGYDKTKIGEQTLKVEYQGVETTLTTPVSFIPDTQPDAKVWSFNSTIYIENALDTKYTIIDLNGRTIKSATTTSTKEEVNLPKSGVFVVVINGKSFKIAL